MTWCGHCSASFQSFVLHHLVIAPSATPRKCEKRERKRKEFGESDVEMLFPVPSSFSSFSFHAACTNLLVLLCHCLLTECLEQVMLAVLHFISVGVSVRSTEININAGDNHNTASGCEKEMPSHCLSNPCPNYSTCQEKFDSYKCACPVGYVGKHCVPVCSLKPCRHGRCEKTNSGKGFQCVCPKQYTGK